MAKTVRLAFPIITATAIPYTQKNINLFNSAILAYWDKNDKSGVTAVDIVNGRNGTYRNSAGVLNGVTLGATGIGDGKTAVTYDGTAGYCNIYPPPSPQPSTPPPSASCATSSPTPPFGVMPPPARS